MFKSKWENISKHISVWWMFLLHHWLRFPIKNTCKRPRNPARQADGQQVNKRRRAVVIERRIKEPGTQSCAAQQEIADPYPITSTTSIPECRPIKGNKDCTLGALSGVWSHLYIRKTAVLSLCLSSSCLQNRRKKNRWRAETTTPPLRRRRKFSV